MFLPIQIDWRRTQGSRQSRPHSCPPGRREHLQKHKPANWEELKPNYTFFVSRAKINRIFEFLIDVKFPDSPNHV